MCLRDTGGLLRRPGTRVPGLDTSRTSDYAVTQKLTGRAISTRYRLRGHVNSVCPIHPKAAFGRFLNLLYDSRNMKNPANGVAAIGLALGAVFGLLGTMVSERNLQAAFWAIDGVGLVVATALLALKFYRTGNDVVASGFLVFAIGEGVMLAGTAGSLAESVPSFAAGAALWSAALLLTSVPREFALWIRLAGIPGAILFAITAARVFGGEQVLPTASPLPFFAYPFLVLTLAGWIWTLLKRDGKS